MKPSALTLANLALAAALLLTPFLVGLTASAPYNPWNDLDDDGDIDIFDIVKISGTYGTTGDPGKNVTIAGRASNLAFTAPVTTIGASSGYVSPWISVNGYSKVTICVALSGVDHTYRLETRHPDGLTFLADQQNDFSADIVKTYDVPNEQIRIYLANYDAVARQYAIDVYIVP